MHRRLHLFAGLHAAFLASCDPVNQQEPRGRDLELTLVTDTMYSIGASAQMTEYMSKVASLGFDGRGNLHLLDLDRYRVATWDNRGQRVRSFGNRGEGPHEFRVPRFAFALHGGKVVVGDIGHASLIVFGPRGQHLRNVRMPTSKGRPTPGSRSVLAGNRLVGIDDYWMKRPPLTSARIPVFSYSLAEDSVETSLFYEAWRAPPDQRGRAMMPRVRLAGFSDGRVAVADSVGYRVKILSETGELENVIERPIHPLPMIDLAMEAERAREKARLTERDISRGLRDLAAVAGISVSDVDTRQLIADHYKSVEDKQFSDQIPVIRSIAVDWDGRLWVTRSNEIGADGPIDIFEADGRYVGTLSDNRTPDAFGPGGLLAYVDDHELGTQSVYVVRVSSITRAR